jgi:hypothetical protein
LKRFRFRALGEFVAGTQSVAAKSGERHNAADVAFDQRETGQAA